MENYTKLNREIAKKLKELEALDEAIAEHQKERDQKALVIDGMQTALKIMNKPTVSVSLRPNSDMEKAHRVLLSSETPLHVDVILEKIGKTGAGAKASLVGSMNAYANVGKLFKKTAPNTFGLIEKDYGHAG